MSMMEQGDEENPFLVTGKMPVLSFAFSSSLTPMLTTRKPYRNRLKMKNCLTTVP